MRTFYMITRADAPIKSGENTSREGIRSNLLFGSPRLTGGFYFCPVSTVLAECSNGPFIAKVVVPDDELVFFDSTRGYTGYRAKRIIVGPFERWANPSILQKILRAGGNTEVACRPTLHYAACNNMVGVVKTLKREKVDVHAHEDFALKAALSSGSLDVAEFLLEGSSLDGDTLFQNAAEAGRLESMRFVLGKLDVSRDGANKALYWAIRSGHLNATRFLCNLGACVQEVNYGAIQIAKEYGYSKVVDFVEGELER